MKVITIVALVALAFCIFACLCHFFRIIRLGKPNDLAEHSGSVTKGVVYANTQAMMPQNKESAYRHLPTYAAGMIFHLGTFLTMLLFVLSLFKPVMDFFMRHHNHNQHEILQFEKTIMSSNSIFLIQTVSCCFYEEVCPYPT